jgi:phosphotransferase system HPr-like phosphotransfer protein
MSHIIDDTKILDITINFCLFYANRYLEAGRKIALDLTRTYIEVGTSELKIPEKLGFHLRPATLVARVANYYGTSLALFVDGQEYDASSVLNITMASGLIARKGVKTVLFKGDRRILHDLEVLARHNYGEDIDGNQVALPPELSHLWN